MKKITSLKLVRQIHFKEFIDTNGTLIPITGRKNTPFVITRLFYIFNLKKGDIRGQHAHRKCQQVLICLRGACEVRCNNGKKKKKFMLSNPSQGLYIPPMIWTSQKFTKNNAILLVLTNIKFDKKDYIRNYKDLLNPK